MTVSTCKVCTLRRYATYSSCLCPFCACFAKNMMLLCEHFPRLGYVGHTNCMLLSVCAPPSLWFQWCLHTVALVPTYILIFQRCLTLQVSPRCGARTHSLSILSCLSLVYICSLGLCLFSGPVCHLLPRRLFYSSPKAHCRRVSHSQFWRALLGGHYVNLVPSLEALFRVRYIPW